MCQRGFARFHTGEFSLKDAPGLGRPAEVDSNQFKTLRTINVIPPRTQAKQSKQVLKIIHTILVMLIALIFGFHISKKNLLNCISTCNFLLKCNKNIPLLRQIVTGNEKRWYLTIMWNKEMVGQAK